MPMISRPVIRFISFLLSWISGRSWKSVYRMSDVLSWIMFDVLRYRKKVIWNNLRNSFPSLTDAELRPIARKFYKHFTDLLLETIKLQNATAEEVRERMTGDTRLVDDLYRQNKSAVFILGHRGNWELANLFAALSFRQKAVVVYKPLSSAFFERWFSKLRTRFGSEMVPMKEVYSYLSTPAKEPFLLFLVNDQSPNPSKAFWTRFLNQDTGVFRGVELISRQHNLPVLYADIQKDESRRGYYKLNMELVTSSPEEVPNNGILQQQIRLLERDILGSPANWLWTHRRWKHRKPEILHPDQLLPASSVQAPPDQMN